MNWDVFAIFLFLFKFEFKNALAVLNAHFSFYRNFNKIASKKVNNKRLRSYFSVKFLPIRYLFPKKKKILRL